MSKIEWTGLSWNPIVGCFIESPGCKNCYAMGQAHRLASNPATPHYAGTTELSKAGPVWTGKIGFSETVLRQPLNRQKPTTYFVNSMGDLFHPNVPDDLIDQAFAVMALCPQHTFQVLTKHAGRMQAYLCRCKGRVLDRVSDRHSRIWPFDFWEPIGVDRFAAAEKRMWSEWPLRNVWLGVSVEDQPRADLRIPHLLRTPAAVRFVSAEPLLGELDLTAWCWGTDIPCESCPQDVDCECGWERRCNVPNDLAPGHIDWVICGGESGRRARPMHPKWAQDLRDQCESAEVPFFFKQWGEWALVDREELNEWGVWQDEENKPELRLIEGTKKCGYYCSDEHGHVDHIDALMKRVGKKAAGRLLDGREWNGMPS